MFGSLILGAIFGAATPYTEPHVTKLVDGAGNVKLNATALGAITFALMMILAAVIIAIFGWNSSLFAASLGGLIGLAIPTLLDLLSKPKDGFVDGGAANPGTGRRYGSNTDKD